MARNGVSRAAVYLLLGASSLLAQDEPEADTMLLCQVAKPGETIPGVPRASDVCMRSLCPRPASAKDPHNTLDAIRDFHVTWLEWTYGNNRDFIRQVHELGVTFGGALAAGSYQGDQPHEVWNVRDREGNPVYATWMRAWKRPNPWGCANHPEFRAGHVRAAVEAIRAGADVLQRDEPAQNKLAVKWGGCFCEHCMAGFNRWLEANGDPAVLQRLGVTNFTTFDYRDYLRAKNAPVGDDFAKWPGDELKTYFERFQDDSTVAFSHWWREELNRQVGRVVPVSCNNGVQQWTATELAYDYCIGELATSRATPELLYAAMHQAASLGKAQIVTMPLRRTGEQEAPDWVRHTRQTIATVYATGGHIEMPWDTYLPTPDAQRYFGKPENYADLTAFVRGMASYLDGYTDAFARGGEIIDDRWLDAQPPVVPLTDAGEVFAFVRAVAGDEAAPVVIHLVDWREEPQPFGLSVSPTAFFGSRPLRFRLLTPASPYDREAHGTADFRTLLRETELGHGYLSTVAIPALGPWGMVVVEPDPTATAGVWPPSFVSSDTEFHQETDVVLACATPGATLHYTLDGSTPTVHSPQYRSPVKVRDTCMFSAVGILDGNMSAVASARFARRDYGPSLLVNGEFDDGLDGWEPVVFPEAGEGALVASGDVSGVLSGPRSVRLEMIHPTGKVYHLRLVQPFVARPGYEYTLSFRAVADAPVHCRVGLQAREAPHKVLGMHQQSIGTVPRRYTLTGGAPEEAGTYLVQFDVGATENAGRTLWIDDVHLAEKPVE